MASPVTSRIHPDSLDPVFRKIVMEEFGKQEDLVSKFFSDGSSDRDQEKVSSITGLGDFTEHVGLIDYDGADQGYDVTNVHKEFSKGIQIERKLLDDEQHGVIKRMFEGFGEAARQTRRKDAVQWLNSAFTVDGEFYTHTEGVALCSNSHTTPRSGVSTTSGFDNLGTAAFSATAVAAARFTMRKFKKFNGEYVDITPDALIVPVELEDEALSFVRTPEGYDTAAKDKNVQSGRYEIISTVELTSSANWFAINKAHMKKSLTWYDRVPLELDRMEHFDTFNFKGRGYMRYSFMYLLWQFCMGHQVS